MRAQGETQANIKIRKIVKKHGKPSGYYSVPTNGNKLVQKLSYRKQIARKLRTQFVEGISVTVKSTLRVTQGHWKRNHWIDHTRLTISRFI